MWWPGGTSLEGPHSVELAARGKAAPGCRIGQGVAARAVGRGRGRRRGRLHGGGLGTLLRLVQGMGGETSARRRRAERGS